MKEKTHIIIKKAALWLLSALVIMLTIVYIIPTFWPFILAFILSMVIDPLIERFCRRFSIKRGYASVFLVTVFLAVFLLALVFIFSRLSSILIVHLNGLSEKVGYLHLPSSDIAGLQGRIASILPEELAKLIHQMYINIRRYAEAVPGRIYSELFGLLSSIIARTPSILFSLLMLALALYFISAGFPGIKSFILRQLPASLLNRVGALKNDIISTLKAWGIAQLKLMALCFLELSLSFFIMRIDHAVLLAAITALVDALPVFGIGIILIPWALFSLISGNYRRTIIISLTYISVNLIRSCAEPRLIGKQTGLHPAAALVSVYAGYKIAGISGMILFPIALMLLKQLNDRGWIMLWK